MFLTTVVGIAQYSWIITNKFRNLDESTELMGFMRTLLYYYTQITSLENGGHTDLIDSKQQIPEFARIWVKKAICNSIVIFLIMRVHQIVVNHPFCKTCQQVIAEGAAPRLEIPQG